MNIIEEKIRNRDFRYEPPWFYNNEYALRCELGIGESKREYLANAKKRAAEIFNILFENDVDMFFFDNNMYDHDFDMGYTAPFKTIISWEKDRLKFCLGFQKKFQYIVVRDIPFDKNDDNNDDLIRRNRICCYPDKKFNAIEVINSQIVNGKNPLIHFVSFDNSCIFSVYDDRGCDIVFFDQNKFRYFYPRLQKYFLDYDRVLMEQRLNSCKN